MYNILTLCGREATVDVYLISRYLQSIGSHYRFLKRLLSCLGSYIRCVIIRHNRDKIMKGFSKNIALTTVPSSVETWRVWQKHRKNLFRDFV